MSYLYSTSIASASKTSKYYPPDQYIPELSVHCLLSHLPYRSDIKGNFHPKVDAVFPFPHMDHGMVSINATVSDGHSNTTPNITTASFLAREQKIFVLPDLITNAVHYRGGHHSWSSTEGHATLHLATPSIPLGSSSTLGFHLFPYNILQQFPAKCFFWPNTILVNNLQPTV